jgi:monoterpene epsilon-lactone hydrolase
MPILNKKKLRPDVLKFLNNSQKLQMEGVLKFVKENPDDNIDFPKLWANVQKVNEQVMKKEIDEDEASKILTMDEMNYLGKMLRFMFEFTSNYNQKQFPVPDNVKIESVNARGVPAEWQLVPNASEEKIIFYLHGGGFLMGSPNSHRLLSVAIGEATKMRVLSIDYSLAPEHPFPAPLEDCVTAYKWLLSIGIKPKNIIIGGDSAGGNLTLSTLLKLKNDGIKLPAGAFCLSAFVDHTISGESFFENAETDPILADIGIFWWDTAYAGDIDKRDPLLSPIFGDLKGLPPILLQASTSEMLYSDSVRFFDKAKAAGVDATLQTWDDMTHVFQGFGLRDFPEAKEAITKIGEFTRKIIT